MLSWDRGIRSVHFEFTLSPSHVDRPLVLGRQSHARVYSWKKHLTSCAHGGCVFALWAGVRTVADGA